MGWKFWKSDAGKSDAERSLEQLTANAASRRPATGPSTRPAAGPSTGASNGSGAVDTGFRMTVDDVFSITGRGTVAIGTVSSGRVRTSQMVTFTDTRGRERRVTVLGIEAARQSRSEAEAGDNVGVLLRGVEKEHVPVGAELWA